MNAAFSVSKKSSPVWLRQLMSYGKTLTAQLSALVYRQEQIRVWQAYDASGEMVWRAYDPLSGHYRFGSEEAVRVWLDTRYNQ